MQDWLDLLGTVNSLREEGVLVEPDALPGGYSPSKTDQEMSAYHVSMLEDRIRTSRFIEAIQ